VDGGATQTITLNQNAANASAIVSQINQQLTGATASLVSVNGKNYLQIAFSTTGTTSSVQILSGTANTPLGLTTGTYTGANEVDLGFGSVSNESFAGKLGVAAAASSLSVVNASGSSQAGGIAFTAIGANGGTQALTFSANDSNGALQSLTITLAATGSGTPSLANDGSASSIDNAVAYINSQLQKSNNPTLQ